MSDSIDLKVRLGVESSTASQQIKAFTSELKTLEKEIKSLDTGTNSFSTNMSNIAKKTDLTKEKIEGITYKLDAYNKKLDEAKIRLQKAQDNMDKLGKRTKENGKEPTVDEIAKDLGVDREEVVVSLDAIQDPVSLQEPVYNDGADSIYIMDQVKDVKNTDELWAENITILEAMKKLSDKEKLIVNKRFFDGRTQMEVAEEIGISQAQVSRLEKSAIERIKRIWK